MSQFFESIKLENGHVSLLAYHEERFTRTVKDFFSKQVKNGLEKSLKNIDLPSSGLYKIRVSYAENIEQISINPYEISLHKEVVIIEKSTIDYAYKYENREALNFEKERYSDAIFTVNGFFTDASYSNLAFFDGKSWISPENYLLKGTKRNYLMDQNVLKAEHIHISDLAQFQKIAFINAMRDFERVYDFEILKAKTVTELKLSLV
jgi:4-amino-4-deoxychorismate lyase